jgi:hypothetical protein
MKGWANLNQKVYDNQEIDEKLEQVSDLLHEVK